MTTNDEGAEALEALFIDRTREINAALREAEQRGRVPCRVLIDTWEYVIIRGWGADRIRNEPIGQLPAGLADRPGAHWFMLEYPATRAGGYS